MWRRREFVLVYGASTLEAVGARGTEVRARALNDYEATIPLEELHSYEVLLALRMEGQPVQVPNKGAMWMSIPDPTIRNLTTTRHERNRCGR